MEKWFRSLTVKQLSTWLKNFEHSTLGMFLNNQPTDEEINLAKIILKEKRRKLASNVKQMRKYERVA